MNSIYQPVAIKTQLTLKLERIKIDSLYLKELFILVFYKIYNLLLKIPKADHEFKKYVV